MNRFLFQTPPQVVALSSLIAMVIDMAREYCQEHDKPGGHFCLGNAEGEPVLILRVEFEPFPNDRASRTRRFCQEKVRRLSRRSTHRTSWESRKPEKNKYGGAIRVEGGFFSFSGLPEHADEALCLRLAVCMKVLTEMEAIYLASLSGNPYISKTVLAQDTPF